MSVAQTAVSISYAANGSIASFAFPYYFIDQNDLIVQQVAPNGVVTQNRLNTDYLLSGTPNTYGDYPNGANVVFNSPPVAGNLVYISRNTKKTQLVIFIDNSPFTADSINHVIDKLTLIVQELMGQFQGTLGAPPPAGTFPPGSWWLNANPQPGGNWGWVVCAGTPNTVNPFGMISL